MGRHIVKCITTGVNEGIRMDFLFFFLGLGAVLSAIYYIKKTS
jgi:hypothetical protein